MTLQSSRGSINLLSCTFGSRRNSSLSSACSISVSEAALRLLSLRVFSRASCLSHCMQLQQVSRAALQHASAHICSADIACICFPALCVPSTLLPLTGVFSAQDTHMRTVCPRTVPAHVAYLRGNAECAVRPHSGD